MALLLEFLPHLLTVLTGLASLSTLLVTGQKTIDPTAPVNTNFDSGLDDRARDQLLELHNVYRREERKASNMNKMEWSAFLEQEAAKWVKGCEFMHQNSPPWGENMYRSTYKTSVANTIDNGLLAWHLEIYNILSGSNTVDCCSTKKKTCCHYTQLVWASSEYLGCAITQCELLKGETQQFDYKDGWYLACYYYPPGNVLTQQPYLRGAQTCGNCTQTNPDCERGLCYFDTSRC